MNILKIMYVDKNYEYIAIKTKYLRFLQLILIPFPYIS